MMKKGQLAMLAASSGVEPCEALYSTSYTSSSSCGIRFRVVGPLLTGNAFFVEYLHAWSGSFSRA